jgi:hypothetical protein
VRNRISLIAMFGSLALVACSRSSASIAPSASAAPSVSSWPILPADPVDAMAAPDEDPVVVAYGKKSGDSLSPKFRACIQRELSTNPKLAGSVTFIAVVNANGTVASTIATEVDGFDHEVIGCMNRVVLGAHFAPAPGDHVVIKIPVALTH